MSNEKTIERVSIKLTQEHIDILTWLANKRGWTASEVLRQCITNEKFFQDHIDAGCKILLEYPSKMYTEIKLNQ